MTNSRAFPKLALSRPTLLRSDQNSILALAKLLALPIVLLASPANGQIVQMPGMGSFNISTSVAVPDRGTSAVGGVGSSSYSRTNTGATRSIGGTVGNTSANISATVIDLDELDRMIRSQASSKATDPKLQQSDPRGFSRVPPKAKSYSPPGYDYLAALSGHTGREPNVTGYGSEQHEVDSDATKYYLSLATQARRRGHWASVETYYRMAWQSLPASRREKVLASLQSSREKASDPRILSKDQVTSKTKANNSQR